MKRSTALILPIAPALGFLLSASATAQPPQPLAAPEANQAPTPRQIAEQAMPSVALIVMDNGLPGRAENEHSRITALASGFVVAEHGLPGRLLIATNHHVIKGASSGHVRLIGREDRLPILGVAAVDEANDLVLLSVEGLAADPLPIGDSSEVRVGDDIYVIGNPHGLEGTFSKGIVSAVRLIDADTMLIQITAPISPGSSGGPVLNVKGEVVGVAMGALEGGQNLNFVVPSKVLASLIHRPGEVRPLPVHAEDREPIEVEDAWALLAEAFRRGADDGDPDAMFNLGLMYANGLGVAKDDAEAVKWLRRAAELGEAAAMFNLGLMYLQGRGVPKDDAEAVKWFRRAAELDHADALLFLGMMYAQGRGVAQDDAEAVKWYRRAAELGNAVAMFNLGMMYAKGRGVPQDDAEAVKWWRRAAELGDADAMFNLGLIYAQGRGVAQDDAEAVKWFRRAAELGHAGAMVILGLMYYEGRGVPQDYVESYVWLSVAAAFGEVRAKNNRDMAEERLTAEARLAAQKRSRELFEAISAQRERK